MIRGCWVCCFLWFGFLEFSVCYGVIVGGGFGLCWCVCLLMVCAGFSWLFVYFVDVCGLVRFGGGEFGLILDFGVSWLWWLVLHDWFGMVSVLYFVWGLA